jgi:hypothetical protein
MQKYHDRLQGQTQQPTPGTATSQQQRKSWHDLAGQYGLEDMFTVSLSVYYGDSTLIYFLQMQKYHDRLQGQTQQPTPGTATSQQQRKSWHDLAGQYGLEDMLDVSSASSALGQGVEEQFELYDNGPLSPRGTDLVGFWGVSTMSRYPPICID